MKRVVIENGIVTNLILVDPANVPDWALGMPVADDNVQIGGTYLAGKFGPPLGPSVEELRVGALERLSDERRKRISGSAVINGFHLWVDLESRTNLTAAVLGTQLDPTVIVQWKTADGVFINLTAPELAALAAAVMAYVQACFANEAVLRAQIEAAEDPVSIDILTGWP